MADTTPPLVLNPEPERLEDTTALCLSGGGYRAIRHARELAAVSTRLSALRDDLQERIINFGYAMAERGVRSHYDPAAFKPSQFPYARGV
jgi:hypothetical protein